MHTILDRIPQLEGEWYQDESTLLIYSTDASAYREKPMAVAIPRTVDDLKKLIAFARSERLSLIPRTGGTSLAGQVVGSGIIVDMSKYFTRILQVNTEEKWVLVEPGVIRDDLNLFLRPYGLFFGPETSTANRAMIGGMVGNNSCGSNSIVYRSTREHLLSVRALLSDGSETEFASISLDEFHQKCEGNGLEASIYRNIRSLLGNYENQQEIRKEFPKKTVERRNTGYALDMLLDSAPFAAGEKDFNFCQLIAGSEGTLAMLTAIKLNLVPLPPPESVLLCVHFYNIDEALRANLIALQYHPSASELIDHYILECTKDNLEQRKNRFFVQGDPGAILVVEYSGTSMDEVMHKAGAAEAAMKEAGLGYYFPLVFGPDAKKIWALRKAGLGLLGNMPGDDKAVPVIEDTAVDVQDLPAYIREFNQILQKHGLYSVHYAHAGSGELHLRPIINLKTSDGNALFRTIAEEIAVLVKKYKGSLSGEHGDGRLRGEFIRQMVGERNYELMRQVKKTWDPDNIFNPHKIVDTPAMNTMLRYAPGQTTPAFRTMFRFDRQDILQHAEQCNGSGDCRKTHLSGGTMCPSYMATRDEKDTTRARANILREFLTHSPKDNRFDHAEIYQVMDLCLSCKGCKSECPSNVDMAKLKAEFLHHYYKANGVPWRARLISAFNGISAMGALWPGFYNFLVSNGNTSRWIKQVSGFATKRSLPKLYTQTLRAWYRKHQRMRSSAPKPTATRNQKVYLFCDEFTNYNDAGIGIKAVQLLEGLGYEVIMADHGESGRASLSKGLLSKAKLMAEKNIRMLYPLLQGDAVLVGIEPSAILCFRDEYPELCDESLLEQARVISGKTFLVEEFLAREARAGKIQTDAFTREARKIKLHGHCQQKALTSLQDAVSILSLPQNFKVETIASGCCGMAGSFGYEKEHFDLSMKIGELVLFPEVRKSDSETLIAAAGTSCRHQIKDGTGRIALHPVEILFEALLPVHA